jgi:hypothetical protein
VNKINVTTVISILLFVLLAGVSLLGATLGGTSSATTYGVGIQIPVNEPITIAAGTYALDTDPALTTGDGKGHWIVPSIYNGWYVTAVGAHAMTASGSGVPTFQITNVTQSVYLCDRLLTIDATEVDSKDALVAATLYSAAQQVSTGDALRLDCSVAGTGTKQVFARIVLSPSR